VERKVNGEKKQVWKPADRLSDDVDEYLSVNAQTLNPGQEGLDLREWYDKKRGCDLDMFYEQGSYTFERLHCGESF
jgi:hypothetical protein